MAYQPPGGAPAASGGGAWGYEFNAAENQIIGKTASRAYLWGLIAVAGGLLGILVVAGLSVWAVIQSKSALPLVAIVVAVPLILINVAIGWSYMGAGKSLRSVVETEGNDIQLLMNGLRKITTAFKIESFVVIGAFVLVILLIGLLILIAGAAVVAAASGAGGP